MNLRLGNRTVLYGSKHGVVLGHEIRRGEHIVARLYGKHRRVFTAGVIADGVHDQVVGQDYTVKAEFLAENAVHLG